MARSMASRRSILRIVSFWALLGLASCQWPDARALPLIQPKLPSLANFPGNNNAVRYTLPHHPLQRQNQNQQLHLQQQPQSQLIVAQPQDSQLEYYDDEGDYGSYEDVEPQQQQQQPESQNGTSTADKVLVSVHREPKSDPGTSQIVVQKQQLQPKQNQSAESNGTLVYDDYYYDDDDYDLVEEQEPKKPGATVKVNGSKVESSAGQQVQKNVVLKTETQSPKPPVVSSSEIPSSTPTTPSTTTTTTTQPPSSSSETAHHEEEQQPEEEAAEAEEEEGGELEEEDAREEEAAIEDEGVHEDEEEDSGIIGEAVVSVVTTKSVVNGTLSVPEPTTSHPSSPTSPSTTTITTPIPTTSTSTTTTTTTPAPISSSGPTTEFNPTSTILASVQTSRSLSGARFLSLPGLVDQPHDQLGQPEREKEHQQQQPVDSTESIIDKLDRVQSELSSGFLANGRFAPRRYGKKPFSSPSSTTSAPLAVATPKPPTKRPRFQTTLDDVSAFLPKDYSPEAVPDSPTPVPNSPATRRPKFQTTLDDISAFLPKDYTLDGPVEIQSDGPASATPAPSSPGTKRPKFQTTLDDVSAFLPKDYPKSFGSEQSASSTSTTTTPAPALTKRPKYQTTLDDLEGFLPKDYKFRAGYRNRAQKSTTSTTSTTTTTTTTTTPEEPNVESSSQSPKANDDTGNETPKDLNPADAIQQLLAKSKVVDVSELLPPGYKKEAPADSEAPSANPKVDPVSDLFAKTNVDISALLPPGYNPEKAVDESSSSTTGKPSPAGDAPFKVVFPTRLGGRKPANKALTTVNPAKSAEADTTAAPKIQKGWPTRATTEFTGWPTSSTTPISIEKLLEAARTATASSSSNSSAVPTSTEEPSTSSTTTTSTTTFRPTTPGVCFEECEVAGTIKIVDNTVWQPELLDHNTHEWQDLGEEIEREMNLVFSKSPVLRRWFRKVRIDSFSNTPDGYILVDYFIELADLREKLNTQGLRVIFHESLRAFGPEPIPANAKQKMPYKLGKFTIDDKATDFVVVPRVIAPRFVEDDDKLLPQWAMAVIVLGVGGLLFTIVVGVSVMANRQNRAKLKPTFYEEQLGGKGEMGQVAAAQRQPAEFPKNESPWRTAESQAMWNDVGWNDKTFESTSRKSLVDGYSPYEKKYNMYDSWRSEWNGYYNYPQSHHSGAHFSRHYPDYDTNF